MGSLIILCAAITFCLFGVLVLRIKQLGMQELQQREILASETRRIETYALRQRRSNTRKRQVTPSEFISEYIDSLLGQQSIIAGTNTQIEHWTKTKATSSPKAYPCDIRIVTSKADEDWIRIEEEPSPAPLKAAS